MAIDVRPGTEVLCTDIVGAWSTVALHRFYDVQVSPHFFLGTARASTTPA